MKFIRYTTLRRKAFGAIVLLLIVGGWGIFAGCNDQQNEAGGRKFTDVSVLENAFQHHQSNLQVTQQGHIVKVLPDDTRGTRHQRFLVKLSSGQTLLMAHNIDLAPRVPVFFTENMNGTIREALSIGPITIRIVSMKMGI